MRIYFSNLNRPKKASKYISKYLNIKLSEAQNNIAKVFGYRDWNDLHREHNKSVTDLNDIDIELIEMRLIDIFLITRNEAETIIIQSHLVGPVSIENE
jgi:hypothetical protein